MHDAAPAPGSTHRNPVLQVSLAPQHAWPAPPQAVHIMVLPAPSTHWPPLWQVSPGQQAAPTAPQFMQVLGVVVPAGFAQPRPALQVLPAQQFWPLAPQGWQVSSPVPPSAGFWQDSPVLHSFAAVPPQHCWPLAPQAWQMGGATPAGSTQTWPVEQVPSPVPPGQHGCPVPPQVAHMVPPPVAAGRHAAPLWQLSPGQQAAPTAPQFMQVLGGVVPAGFEQPRPALQTSPAQQF